MKYLVSTALILVSTVALAEPAYVGRWTPKLSWCTNNIDETDELPIVLEANKLHGYENVCTFNKVSGEGPWEIQMTCEDQGEATDMTYRMEIDGDALTMQDLSKSEPLPTYYRCPLSQGMTNK